MSWMFQEMGGPLWGYVEDVEGWRLGCIWYTPLGSYLESSCCYLNFWMTYKGVLPW